MSLASGPAMESSDSMFRGSCGATMIECRVSTSESVGVTSRIAAWSSSSAGSESRPCGSISRSAGPAMNVIVRTEDESVSLLVDRIGEVVDLSEDAF